MRAAGVRLETTDYELGAAHYLRTGEVLPDAGAQRSCAPMTR